MAESTDTFVLDLSDYPDGTYLVNAKGFFTGKTKSNNNLYIYIEKK